MRAVVMSMKPQWWEKILTREKTMEIRKTMPRGGAGGTEPWPMLVLVYVSGTGEIQGQFLCGGWVKTNLLAGMEKQSCVPLHDLVEYAGGPGGSLCGWIVKDPRKYEVPRKLEEFGLARPPMSWQYIEIENGGNDHGQEQAPQC